MISSKSRLTLTAALAYATPARRYAEVVKRMIDSVAEEVAGLLSLSQAAQPPLLIYFIHVSRHIHHGFSRRHQQISR